MSSTMAGERTVRILLDTSYCLFLIRQRPSSLRPVFEAYTPGEVAVSALTVAVLESIARNSTDPVGNRAALDQFLLPLVVVDFDSGAAHQLGQLGDRGFDSAQGAHTHLLAAQALELNATLVTASPALYQNLSSVRVQAGMANEVDRQHGDTAGLPAAYGKQDARGATVIRVAGSHDLSLILLGDWLHAEHPGISLATAATGSVAGLHALLDGSAHVAATHLLDEETGEFNVSHICRILTPRGMRVVLLGFVRRVQGLIVAPGNPRGIRGLEDLTRADVRFVNRQPGAGTRVLLDYHLHRLGILKTHIAGYDRSETTHLAVATAVAQGSADCGLGIQAAARALDLEFLPLCDERFDLVIPVEQYTSPRLVPLLALLRQPSPAFRERIAALGGYDTGPMGEVLAEL